ncbi:hypothetical protein BDY17DRAFT_64246 [Neohortaea acidophila]|uniref:Uncharacterized protein n=1 Tax=Neohortaea acidophila TaxID=245834 RepID=A0A6A6PF36_9PEZI|nr:uncharacterized protein BDY17DRAFT_64246 [Neohortaea acidophila]KAF2478545.1 hypothetical protein BDY17DRAFT_64246 [Neohortaea acidophila]
MGKSNKFDYTNRPNSGAKLGHIIGTALQKEAEKGKKDAEKQAIKARKQSSSSSSAPTDAPPAPTAHVIELIAPNKDLGDEGTCALLDGLYAALSTNGDVSLALEVLDLSSNAITTASLPSLARVIELAKNELKVLSLANNKITVTTQDAAEHWASFLKAFRHCSRLRRLDLSGNQDLGSRALEILARTHVSEPHIDPIPSVSDEDAFIPQARSSMSRSRAEQNEEPEREQSDLASNISGEPMSTRCGLRSIPYISLRDIGLNDSGAMWLSYVLEDHHYPNQLLPDLVPAQSDSTPTTARAQDKGGRGLEWTHDGVLSREGVQLLEKAEARRWQTMVEDNKMAADTDHTDVDSLFGDGGGNRRKSSAGAPLTAVKEDRRTSIKSLRSTDAGEQEANEIDSARKRLKRAIIARDGAFSVELWHAALTLVNISRLLLYVTPMTGECSDSPQSFSSLPDPSMPPVPAILAAQDSAVGESGHRLCMNGHNSQACDASRLAVSTRETALTDATNTPITPMLFQKPKHRKGAFSEGNDLDSVVKKLNVLMIRNQDPMRFIRHQQAWTRQERAEGRPFRNPSSPCPLPFHIVMRIVGQLMSGREISVLTEEQRRAAVQWGLSRETFATEREWLRKDDSAQILMLLDSIHCLAYAQ